MAQKVEGVYTFQRQELVASFNFSAEGTFEFFYSYGASDRMASGTYSISGDTVKLHSKKEPGKDFSVTKESKKGSGFHVTVKDNNPYLVNHVLAVVISGGKENYFESDEKGIINIDLPSCEKIYLQHTLFPDVLTLIRDEKNTNNYFEVALNPSLAQVSFKGIDLIIQGDELSCLPNYFLPMENIRFIKE